MRLPTYLQHKLEKVRKGTNGHQDGHSLFIQRLRREVAIWSSLDHPHVLPLLGHYSGHGLPFGLVSPLCTRGDINKFIASFAKARGQLALLELKYRLLFQVTLGLEHCGFLLVCPVAPL
jgi:serine/threonine protein kinase